MLCDTCGQTVPDEARFCLYCGKPFRQLVRAEPKHVVEAKPSTDSQGEHWQTQNQPIDEEEILRAIYEKFTSREYNEALKLCHAGLAVFPNSGDLYIMKAQVLYFAKSYLNAIEALDIAFRLGSSPTSTYDVKLHALTFKGSSLVKLGRYEEAVEVLRQAVALHPKHDLAWSYMHDALRALGRKEEAKTAYMKGNRTSYYPFD